MNNNFKVGIDVDGVLADFHTSFFNVMHTAGCPVNQAKLDDLTFPDTWNYFESYGATPDQVKAAWKLVTESPFFWVRLPDYASTRRDCQLLQANIQNGVEVYFITTRPGVYAHFQTVAWLSAHGITAPQVLLAKGPEQKGLLARGLELNAMIDDRPENLEALPASCQAFLMKPHRGTYNQAWYWEHQHTVIRVESVQGMFDLLAPSEITL